ncbi:MAG: winged helix DNA-binding domain-containing protein [Anaerolineales bacterium]|nr:winged helix DNA-binding domain-containing protein [Anaerolineales bacterium]
MPAASISAAALTRYRAGPYRLQRGRQLRTADDAVAYITERGFVYFWPIKGVDLPSLWTAVAGDRPVADKHDDPGHVTWRWKDALLDSRRWYYGKLLKGKATLVSLATLPYFYALSDNYGDPDDYLLEYEAGRLTLAAKTVYEVLRVKGALDSLALRREAHLLGKESNTRYERALVDLQRALRILPVGIATAGRWNYAHIYELLDRWFPSLPAQARPLGRGEARAHLLDLYLQSVGAATAPKAAALFGWRLEDTRQAAKRLVAVGRAASPDAVAGESGEWLATAALC